MMRWLDTLAARTVLLMLIGVGIVHVASLYAYQHALRPRDEPCERNTPC